MKLYNLAETNVKNLIDWQRRIAEVTHKRVLNDDGYYSFGQLWVKPGRMYDAQYERMEMENTINFDDNDQEEEINTPIKEK
jgi:hypothetical protein